MLITCFIHWRRSARGNSAACKGHFPAAQPCGPRVLTLSVKLRRRQETLSFDDAIDAEPERLAGEKEKLVRDPKYYSSAYDWHSYLARGRYLEQILRWQRVYSPDQLLFLESGEFFKCTADVYQQVLRFLKLSSWQPTRFANRFPGRYDDKIAPPLDDGCWSILLRTISCSSSTSESASTGTDRNSQQVALRHNDARRWVIHPT